MHSEPRRSEPGQPEGAAWRPPPELQKGQRGERAAAGFPAHFRRAEAALAAAFRRGLARRDAAVPRSSQSPPRAHPGDWLLWLLAPPDRRLCGERRNPWRLPELPEPWAFAD